MHNMRQKFPATTLRTLSIGAKFSPALLIAYPVWFMWKLLSPSSTSHLGAVANDINLTIEEVQALSRMPFPWSPSSFRTYPDSVSFWRIEHLVDVPQKAYFWLMSRLFEPTFIINTYQLLGLFLTGFVVYLLCRRLEISRLIAIGAGVCAQSLPVMRQMMLTGVAANYNAIFPILMIIAILRITDTVSTARRLVVIAGTLLGAFVTSAYQFNYTFLIFVIFLLMNLSSLTKWFGALNQKIRLSLTLITVTLGAGIFVFAEQLRKKTVNEYGKPYGVYSTDDVMKDVYSLKGYVSPDRFHFFFPGSKWELEGYSQQYGGLIYTVLAIGAVILLAKAHHRKKAGLVAVIAIVMVVLSLGRIQVGGVEIPAVREFLRFVMIGNRRYAIAGLIAQVLIVVLFAYFLDYFSRRHFQRRSRMLVVVIVMLIAFLDVNPASRRVFNTYADRYSDVRFKLNSGPNSALYVSPLTESAKNFYVFDYPIFMNNAEVFANASISDENFAQVLAAKGVRFVLALVNGNNESYISGYIQNSVRFSTVLSPEFFTQVSPDITLRNTDEDGSTERQWKVRLLEVKSIQSERFRSAYQLAQFVSSPILEVADPNIDRYRVREEWATAATINFRIEALPSEVNYETGPEVAMIATLVAPPYSETPIRISLQSSFGSRQVFVGAQPITVRMKARMYEQITISSDSPCPIGDNPQLGALLGRPICFGITDFAILQSSK